MSKGRDFIRPNFRENPHMRQLGSESCGVFVFSELERILGSEAPRKRYERVPHNQRSVNHWGQRKLLLSEIEFLTLYGEPGCLVVYAGAAPGTHTAYLANLFPEMKFLCVDPAEFKLKSSDRIEVRRGFFTDDTVEELRARSEPILFISDIRTGDPKVQNSKEVEEAVKFDQELQKNWVLKLNPKASMLKFRLPWEGGVTEYLDGQVYLPIWGRETTTETRLISVSPYKLVKYDNKKYEEQCFYFNRVTRVQYYEHPVMAEGMDHCYDCASEDFVLQEYLTKHSSCPRDRLVDEAKEMSMRISRECSPQSLRTLEMSESFSDRQKWFAPRVYNYEKQTIQHVARVNDPVAVYSTDRKRERDSDELSRKERGAQPPRKSAGGAEEEDIDYGGLVSSGQESKPSSGSQVNELFRYRVEQQAEKVLSGKEKRIEFAKLSDGQRAVVEQVMMSKGVIVTSLNGVLVAETKTSQALREFHEQVDRHLERLRKEGGGGFTFDLLKEDFVQVVLDKAADEVFEVNVQPLVGDEFKVTVGLKKPEDSTQSAMKNTL